MIADDITKTKTWTYVKEAFERTLNDYESIDYSILAYALTIPSQGTLVELMKEGTVDPIAIHKARGRVKRALGREFQFQLKTRYDSLTKDMMNDDDEFQVDSKSIGRRRLR